MVLSHHHLLGTLSSDGLLQTSKLVSVFVLATAGVGYPLLLNVL